MKKNRQFKKHAEKFWGARAGLSESSRIHSNLSEISQKEISDHAQKPLVSDTQGTGSSTSVLHWCFSFFISFAEKKDRYFRKFRKKKVRGGCRGLVFH